VETVNCHCICVNVASTVILTAACRRRHQTFVSLARLLQRMSCKDVRALVLVLSCDVWCFSGRHIMTCLLVVLALYGAHSVHNACMLALNTTACTLLYTFVMVALSNRADHYVFILWFLLLSFFPHLVSAVAELMSAILAHMVWP